MASSKTDICNIALGFIGISERVTDIATDDTAESRACLTHYDNVLDSILGRFDWTFARRLITLTEDAGDPPQPWAYHYQWPADIIRPIRIDDERSRRGGNENIPFRTYTNSSGERVILTNANDAKLWYTHRETNVAIYPQWFIVALAWSLAAEIAGPLIGEEKAMDRAEQRAMQKMSEAVALDAESEQEDPEMDAEHIRFRSGEIDQSRGALPAHDYLL